MNEIKNQRNPSDLPNKIFYTQKFKEFLIIHFLNKSSNTKNEY